jgi:hypothetical protein
MGNHSGWFGAVGAVTLCLALAVPQTGSGAERQRAGTFYVARLTTVNAWHDIVTDPGSVEFADSYVAVAAVSRPLRWYRERAASLFGEGQVGYNFGDQSHWEFNVAAGPRWHRFPWNHHVATTAAFGLGLSYATEVPETEVVLETTSEQLLIYWMTELTLGPPHAHWAVSLRLHHRSPGFGLFADEGGMNALGAGVRFEF